MAADDDRGPAPDPWDDIVADELGDAPGEVSFRFEDAPAEETSAEEASAAGATELVAESPVLPDTTADTGEAAAVEAADNALVEEWLSDDAPASEVPPLSVFAGEESSGGSSAIDIGTGASGIGLHGTPTQEEIGDAGFPGITDDGDDTGAGWPAIDTSAGESDDGAATGGFPDVAPAPAVAAAAGAAAKKVVKRPAKPAKKAGGIGQMVGVVLGGLMAIPITLAILIYGLGKDPFGITKKVPSEVAFLLPAKFRPGYKKPAASSDAPGGSALDALPTALPETTEPAVDPLPADPVEPAPADPIDGAVPAPDMPADPTPEPDVAAIDPPGLDALDPPAPVAPPEPPPLDTAALDEAVGEATALSEALGIVDDKENRAYKLLRTRWYRALARVAEELVAVENTAATTGRPLTGAPDNVAALHGSIGGREALVAELAALAPDWLAYAKRGSDGVVLPATFDSARKVGPYWSARVTLTGADGQPRALTVITRGEPAAIAGDRVVVTGVALDGAVIWAADVRGGDAAAVDTGGVDVSEPPLGF